LSLEGKRRLVMRTVSAVLTLVAALSVSSKLYADEPNKDRNGAAERIQDLNLTDEQEAKIAEIRKESRPKVEEAVKDLAVVIKEEEDKVREALTPEQREKAQALKDERKEHRSEGLAARLTHLKDLDLTDAEMSQLADIQKEYRPKITKAMEGMHGILTDEQKKARQEALQAGKPRREVLSSLNLTDDQKEKMATVCKEVHGLVREELEKMRDVLSAEQQEKLPELKDERRDRIRDRWAARIANLQELNLTDEQKTKLADIRKEYRPKVHEAGNKLRGAVREEVGAILAVIKGS
jgi:Spy/CpxP family protein refolding chaperone